MGFVKDPRSQYIRSKCMGGCNVTNVPSNHAVEDGQDLGMLEEGVAASGTRTSCYISCSVGSKFEHGSRNEVKASN